MCIWNWLGRAWASRSICVYACCWYVLMSLCPFHLLRWYPFSFSYAQPLPCPALILYIKCYKQGVKIFHLFMVWTKWWFLCSGLICLKQKVRTMRKCSNKFVTEQEKYSEDTKGQFIAPYCWQIYQSIPIVLQFVLVKTCILLQVSTPTLKDHIYRSSRFLSVEAQGQHNLMHVLFVMLQVSHERTEQVIVKGLLVFVTLFKEFFSPTCKAEVCILFVFTNIV